MLNPDCSCVRVDFEGEKNAGEGGTIFFTSSENVNTPMPWGRFCKTIRHNQVQARELKVKKAGTSLSTSPQYLPSSKKASARGL
jgi:hypothetical protein